MLRKMMQQYWVLLLLLLLPATLLLIKKRDSRLEPIAITNTPNDYIAELAETPIKKQTKHKWQITYVLNY
jgi:hypothetical protein